MTTIEKQIKELHLRYRRYNDVLALLTPSDIEDASIIAVINFKQEKMVAEMMGLRRKLKAEKIGLKLVSTTTEPKNAMFKQTFKW